MAGEHCERCETSWRMKRAVSCVSYPLVLRTSAPEDRWGLMRCNRGIQHSSCASGNSLCNRLCNLLCNRITGNLLMNSLVQQCSASTKHCTSGTTILPSDFNFMLHWIQPEAGTPWELWNWVSFQCMLRHLRSTKISGEQGASCRVYKRNILKAIGYSSC